MGPGDGGRCWKRNISLCGSFFHGNICDTLGCGRYVTQPISQNIAKFLYYIPGGVGILQTTQVKKV